MRENLHRIRPVTVCRPRYFKPGSSANRPLCISNGRYAPNGRRNSKGRNGKCRQFLVGQLERKNASRGARLEGRIQNGHYCTRLLWGDWIRLSAPQGFANADVKLSLIYRRSRYPPLFSGRALIKNAWIGIFAESGRSWRYTRHQLPFLHIGPELRPASEHAVEHRTRPTTGHKQRCMENNSERLVIE